MQQVEQIEAFGVYATDGYLLEVAPTLERGNQLFYHHYSSDVESRVVAGKYWGYKSKYGTTVYRTKDLAEQRLAPVGHWY